jgi:putative PIG3 family NAD(P)H quinone oxidoreductase
MKALCIGDNQLLLKKVALPEKKSEEQILIRVHSMGLNRADLLAVDGLYPPPDDSIIPGLELAGVREDNGEAVCALVSSGAFAEYIYVYPQQILPLPDNLDLTRAAALPEALLTCWLNLFEIGRLAENSSLLIHGGSSGIGSFAMQMAKAYHCRVFATVGDDVKKDFCLGLGAEGVYNYKEEDYVEAIKALGGVDLVLDILGGDYLDKNISCLKPNGRIALIAVMAGSRANINAAALLMKNIAVTGSTLRSKSLAEKRRLISSAVTNIYPHIESGKIMPKIDLIYNFADYQDAFARMRSRKNLGKILMVF